MTARRTNNRLALRLEEASRADDFAAFDALPLAVRACVAQQVTDLGCASVLAYFRSIDRQARELGGSPLDAEIWTLRKLGAVEGAEMDAFAARHLARYGHALPHAAAEATVQRYVGSGFPRRRPRRPLPEIRGLEIREAA